MSVRTRVSVDIVTEYGISSRDLRAIEQNAGALVNFVATSELEDVRPSVDVIVVATSHTHESDSESLCRGCVNQAQDQLS